MRLNKFIAASGMCSRRKADELIESGRVTVNGVLVQSMGVKVERSDTIAVDKKDIKPEKRVYLLFNKPKNAITTLNDPQGRKTIFDVIKYRGEERIFPVGRLDRMTCGLLVLTNDGDLADNLMHPRNKVKKIYHVVLNKALVKADEDKIHSGIEMEEGVLKVDAIGFPVEGTRKEIGIEVHLGWNRVIRRLFETLGYEVEKLDRVYYAGLTKLDLPRGRWRHLKPTEVRQLKSSKRVLAE